MARTTKVISFSVPPDMVDKINKIAKRERRNKSELLRDMVNTYEECKLEGEWESLFAFGAKTAKQIGLKSEEELFKFLNKPT